MGRRIPMIALHGTEDSHDGNIELLYSLHVYSLFPLWDFVAMMGINKFIPLCDLYSHDGKYFIMGML